MRRLRAAIARLIGLVSRERRERAFDDELDSHLQLHIDDNLRAGMSAEEARRRALLKLGGVESTRQAYRERSSVPLLEHSWQDLRFAVRQLDQDARVHRHRHHDAGARHGRRASRSTPSSTRRWSSRCPIRTRRGW